MYKITQEEARKIKRTLSLLSSMTISGEQHSKTSKHMLEDSLSILNKPRDQAHTEYKAGKTSTKPIYGSEGYVSFRVPIYDSTKDTLLHIKRVNQLLTEAAMELLRRGIVHDDSKLEPPEKHLFDKYTPKLKETTYGSKEYKEYLDGLKLALDHHYARNSHHPEHYVAGINGFDLFDLIEMFFDWKAATERHEDGDIMRSIEINKERFNMSDQVSDILRNTAIGLGYNKL